MKMKKERMWVLSELEKANRELYRLGLPIKGVPWGVPSFEAGLAKWERERKERKEWLYSGKKGIW